MLYHRRLKTQKSPFIIVTLFVAAIAAYASENTKTFDKLMEMANAGNAQAQYNVGMFYNNGIGLPRDPKQAFDWFKKSAANGDPLAAYKMSSYYAGHFQGVVNPDNLKSLQYNLVAGKAGYILAQLELGDIYAAKNDFWEAARWWKLAGEQGDAGSLQRLALLQKDGKGVEKDLVLAYVNLRLAAQLSKNESNSKAIAQLQEFKANLSSTELSRAEHLIAVWKPKISIVTLRARKGIHEAEELIKSKE